MLKLFATIALAATLVLAVPSAALAADSSTLPGPGITPDSPFYFVERLQENISMMFTFGAQAKAEKTLRFADERLAETLAMAERNKAAKAEQAAREYRNCLEFALRNMQSAGPNQTEVSRRLALRLEQHLEIIGTHSDNATGNGLRSMEQCRETARTCQETALRKMAERDPGQAMQVDVQLRERQMARLRQCASDGDGRRLQECLQECTRLENLGEQIRTMARSLGQGTTVDQLVETATSYKLQVLSQVRETVREQARAAIDEAIQECIQAREQVQATTQAREQGQEMQQQGQQQEQPATAVPVPSPAPGRGPSGQETGSQGYGYGPGSGR